MATVSYRSLAARVALLGSGLLALAVSLPRLLDSEGETAAGWTRHFGSVPAAATAAGEAVLPEDGAPPAAPERTRVLFSQALSSHQWARADAGGGRSEDYWVTIFARSSAGWQEVHRHRIGFATELFAAADDHVYYATRHARIGVVSSTRGFIGEVVHRQTPTALAATAAGAMVSDRTGALTRYSPAGIREWSVQTGSDPILGVVMDAKANRFFAWNSKPRGYWGELDSGRLLAEAALPESPVAAGRSAEGYWLRGAKGEVWLRPTEPASRPSQLWWVVGAVAGGLAVLAGWVGPGCRWRQGFKQCWEARVAYAFLLPGFLLLAVFEYWPAVTAALYSFFSYSLVGEPEFIGWANYRSLLSDPYFWTGFRNMVIITVALIGKTLVLPLLVAELVFWLGSARWRSVYRFCFLLPAVVPGLVTVLLWKMIYDPQIGFLNDLLRLMGAGEFVRPWLGDAQTALGAVIFTGFPWISIVSFLVLLGGLLNIDSSLFEAAQIDGAGNFRRFWRLDVPLLLPQIKLLTILAVIQGIQEFSSILVMTRGGPGLSTYVPALHMFLETSEAANLGYASAIGITLFVLVALATAALKYAFHKAEGS